MRPKPGDSDLYLSRTSTWLLLFPFLGLYLLFVLLPSLGLVIKAFTTNNSLDLDILQPATLFHEHYTLYNYLRLLNNPYYQRVIANTLLIALSTVLITMAIGTPVAYLLSRRDFKRSGTLQWFITLPTYLPSVVAAYSLVIFFGPYGVLNTVIGLVFKSRMVLVFSIPAVVAGTVYITLPVYIRNVVSAFKGIPSELVEASYSLGGTEFYTLTRVLLPLAFPGILAAVILNFSFAVGLIEVALIVGGGSENVPYLPVEIMLKATSFGYDIPFASAMATVVFAISLLGQLCSMLLLRRKIA
ncbi:ABC transporter permease [Moorella naiadis]|uniref:ABC transporter permease n=1 Tax=Moorella naiadis (nom. illeg.) TaxID=3093670 RepID=UPI003D9C9D38